MRKLVVILPFLFFSLNSFANAESCKRGNIYSVEKATGLDYSTYQEFSLKKNTAVRYLGRDNGGNVELRAFEIDTKTQECELEIRGEKVTQICTSQLIETEKTLTLMFSKTKLNECTI